MKKILFIVIPEKGHINPSIGVAQHLQSMGHDITFYAPHDISEQLNLAGLHNFIGPLERCSDNQGKDFAKQVQDKVWLRNWIKELLIDNAYAGIEPLRKIVKNYDIVICDPMIYAAVIACEKENILWVALSNSLNPVLDDNISSDLLDTVDWLSESREQLFDQIDISFRGCDALSPNLTIAFSTSDLTTRSVEGVKQVGPAKTLHQRGDEASFPWGKIIPNIPIIYASFGSQIYHQPEIFNNLIIAISSMPVQLIAATHDLEFDSVPDKVILCGYSPQIEILKKSDILITHGGANSVMESLAANVPVLINPICNDQFHQAYFLEKSKSGRLINLLTMSTEQIREQINWALTADISHVSESYQVDGSYQAATLINGL